MDQNVLLKAQSEVEQDRASLREAVGRMSDLERTLMFEAMSLKFTRAKETNDYISLVTNRLAMTMLTELIISIKQESGL